MISRQPCLAAIPLLPTGTALAPFRVDGDRLTDPCPCSADLTGQVEAPVPQFLTVVDLVPLTIPADEEPVPAGGGAPPPRLEGSTPIWARCQGLRCREDFHSSTLIVPSVLMRRSGLPVRTTLLCNNRSRIADASDQAVASSPPSALRCWEAPDWVVPSSRKARHSRLRPARPGTDSVECRCPLRFPCGPRSRHRRENGQDTTGKEPR
jgi:hypothetical protein